MTRVLLVEDSPDVLYVLQLELEGLGYQIDAAPDAAAALDTAVRVRPDIIISDLGLPGIDGFEFIRRVRGIPDLASVPAIALTGSTSDRNVRQALSFGFTAHVVKPVEIADLAKRIEQLTSRRLRRKAG
jgi:two-component system CheB/CheR fusion protein